MKKPVIVRFRHDTTTATGHPYVKGTELEVTPGPDVARLLYGTDIDILRYSDGEPYELNLKEQAAERKESAEDDVVAEQTAAPKAAKP